MLAENRFGGACTETLNTFRQTTSRQNENRSLSSTESVGGGTDQERHCLFANLLRHSVGAI